ncbi:MAG TPA: tyrosine-type recombinase/integrase [Amycolatopsis sp.]|uniref:tyrosine-type recombinase/integrase n=1 Tax=Amycolatopsis sp. TaxID=37632 RepID=UPI002B49FB8C|nr:tyrosine-type recombinase/integrase [Amycolatopsis sp.]HKS45525.1 tyrosine-type recombinase/integrase [Amycolatopsis sp.]
MLIFLSPKEKPVTPHNYGARLAYASEQAKAPKRGPYTVRRGFATRVKDGVDIFDLAAVMGHSDIRQTQEYVQTTPTAPARLLAALGERPPLKAVPGAEPELQRHAATGRPGGGKDRLTSVNDHID